VDGAKVVLEPGVAFAATACALLSGLALVVALP
jgi:hypothetical protein